MSDERDPAAGAPAAWLEDAAARSAAQPSIPRGWLEEAAPQPDLEAQRIEQELEDMRQDRQLRSSYAKWWVGICIVQLAVMNVFLCLVGTGVFQFESGLFHAYLIGTFAECAGIVWVITRNLFPYRDQRKQAE